MSSFCPPCSDTRIQPLGGFPGKPCQACAHLSAQEFAEKLFTHCVGEGNEADGRFWLGLHAVGINSEIILRQYSSVGIQGKLI